MESSDKKRLIAFKKDLQSYIFDREFFRLGGIKSITENATDELTSYILRYVGDLVRLLPSSKIVTAKVVKKAYPELREDQNWKFSYVGFEKDGYNIVINKNAYALFKRDIGNLKFSKGGYVEFAKVLHRRIDNIIFGAFEWGESYDKTKITSRLVHVSYRIVRNCFGDDW
jgi:hypothetical protein